MLYVCKRNGYFRQNKENKAQEEEKQIAAKRK